MSAISLTDARAILAGLIDAQKKSTAYGSVTSTSGRSVSFQTLKELTDAIKEWSAIVTGLERAAAGASGFGRSVATFYRR